MNEPNFDSYAPLRDPETFGKMAEVLGMRKKKTAEEYYLEELAKKSGIKTYAQATEPPLPEDMKQRELAYLEHVEQQRKNQATINRALDEMVKGI